MMAGIHEYCKQEGLNYPAEEEEGSRGLRRARPPRAAAVFLRGALLRGGLEPGELLRRGASLRLGLGRGAVGARRARAYRHGAEVTCGIYSRNSIRDISDAVSMPRQAASSKGLRGSSVRREAGDGAPVDVRGVMPLTVAALARTWTAAGRVRGRGVLQAARAPSSSPHHATARVSHGDRDLRLGSLERRAA